MKIKNAELKKKLKPYLTADGNVKRGVKVEVPDEPDYNGNPQAASIYSLYTMPNGDIHLEDSGGNSYVCTKRGSIEVNVYAYRKVL